MLEVLWEGLTTTQVADRLFVSPVTVRRHVSAAVTKLEVPDRAAAIELFDRSVEAPRDQRS